MIDYLKLLLKLLLTAAVVSCTTESPDLAPIAEQTEPEEQPQQTIPKEEALPKQTFHLIKIDALGINACEEYDQQVNSDVEIGVCPSQLDIPSTFGNIVPKQIAGCQYQDYSIWYYESTPLGEAGSNEDLAVDPEVVKLACQQGADENSNNGIYLETDYVGPGFIRSAN